MRSIFFALALTFCSVAFSQTVKITTFNVQWLGCPTQRPNDDELQLRNVAKVIELLDADIVALQEITMKPVNSLEVLLGHLGSAWGGEVKLHTNNDCHQDMGIIYKKASVTLSSSAWISTGWARNPALYSVNVTKNGKTIPLEIVNIHAKAMGTQADYNKRVTNSKALKFVLDGNSYKNKNIVLIGDYNDYLQGTQCGECGGLSGTSPYKNFVDDASSYKGLTGHLQNPYYNNPVIDNIIISNELFHAYVSDSTKLETTVTDQIPSYRYTTSDHTPVSITLNFDNATATPKNTYSAQLQLYPNPTQHTLHVESMSGNIAAVKVCNLIGTVIYEQSGVHAPLLNISTSAWQNGLYVVTVYSEKGEVGSRLMMKN